MIRLSKEQLLILHSQLIHVTGEAVEYAMIICLILHLQLSFNHLVVKNYILVLRQKLQGYVMDLGINVTTAFTIFAKKLTREKRIPFDPFYSQNNLIAINESIEQIRQRKMVVKTMDELEEMENE